MALFSKPKAKAIAKPRTAEESMAVKAALRKKYPQMSEPGWGKPKKVDESAWGKIKAHEAGEAASLEEALSEEELKKFGYRKRK